MRYIAIFLLIAVTIVFALVILKPEEISEIVNKIPSATNNNSSEKQSSSAKAVNVIAKNLDTPWAIAFLPASPSQGGPDNSMLVTERNGTVQLVDKNGNVSVAGKIDNAREIGEGGLLGIALHPDFLSNNYVYFYYTYSGSGDSTLNRVVRMTLRQAQGKPQLTDEKIIIDKIPGASNHNGGRIKFGPDKLLYIGTGDAQNPSQAQSKNTLGGKILRITDEGKIPAGNKFKNPVYSYGHRNVQGLAWDENGNLWATEHGRSGVLSGLDELNLIENGNNYGWPNIQGDQSKTGMIVPKRNSGSDTWAPSGAAYLNGSVFFSGLRGQALYEAVIENNQITEVKEHFKGQFGRIREVILGPDRMIYITTSNRDGRGNPVNDDDKVIRINPLSL